MRTHRDMDICKKCSGLRIAKGIGKFVFNCSVADGGWRTEKMHNDWYIPDNCLMKMEYIVLKNEESK